MAIYFLLHFYEAFHRARQEQVLLREAATLSQLEALRLQLNPHFLFNALNSIRALIPPDAGEAREGVTRLAGVLRATLGNAAGSTVPLRRELEVVRDYLAIEKLRFGGHLQICDRLDASVEDATIPPLMLLTIIENAIKHGAQSQEHASEITIKGHMEDQEVLISVESPGVIRSPADGSVQGIGLKNVRERLQLIYGPGASATLESTDHATTKCTLRYPVKSSRNS
jgi:LytS/YehU family sensor histidine kinase